MSRRKRQEPKNTQPTRKEILRERKTARDRQMLLGVLLPIAAIVVVIVGIGMMRELYQKPRQPVARVDNQPITAAEYVDRLAYERMQLLNSLQTFSDYAMTTSGNENFLADFARQSRDGLPGRTVDLLVDEMIIRKEAEARGIEVTDEDVTEEIYSQLPSTEAFKRLQASGEVTATETVEELEGGEPTSEKPADSSVAAGKGITSTDGTTTTAKITPTLSAEVIAGATKGANDDYELIVRQGVLARTGISESRYREIVRSQLYRERLQEALADEIESTAEQVEVAHMAFESEDTANAAKAALEGGADWAEVVARFQDPATTEPITDTAGLTDLGTNLPLTTTTGATGTLAAGEGDTLAAEGDQTEPLAEPAELLANAGITATTGVTETQPLTGTLGTPEAPPTAVPSPFFKSSADRTWMTRQGLKDDLGLSDEEVTTVIETEPGDVAGPMAGRDGSYVIVVYDVDKERELPKEELEAKRSGALDAWLQTKRIQVGVDRFPLDSLTPEEPAWFATLYEQIVGVPVNALPTDALSISTVAVPAAVVGTPAPVVVTAPAP